MNINWYPGHMAKTKREIIEDLRLIDVVIELLDARIPISSQNPDVKEYTKGKRKITPNADVMVHQPSGGAGGKSSDILISANRIIKMREKLEKHLSNFTGQTIEKIHEDCEKDYWMDAEEAVKYGIVDEIIEL
jgi:hypothetical protein